MKLSEFDYNYPEELVAQRPLPSRDDSRMMIAQRQSGAVLHSRVSKLDSVLQEGDLVIVNDSRVIPARIFGQRATGEKIELLVVEPAPSEKDSWRCLLKRARRMRSGEQLFFGMQAKATVRRKDGVYLIVQFAHGALDLAMRHHGVPPLPPYIKREGIDAYTQEDRERYQTVYADKPGSAAAPTAGLHLGDELLARLEGKGISIARVTLHVGIDTFTPVRVDDLAEHRMHGERVEISEAAAREIARAREEKRRVVAVGTTAARALESASQAKPAGDSSGVAQGAFGSVAYGSWVTDLFILPGYEFRIVDAMLTNFHQPRSTLLMMVSAFAGREFILSCYEQAIRERYRLFSYGDCMLIL